MDQQPKEEMQPTSPKPALSHSAWEKYAFLKWPIIIGIFLLVGVPIVVYTLSLEQSNQAKQSEEVATTEPIQPPSPISDPPADWATFNNQAYDFTLRYPATFQTREHGLGYSTDKLSYEKDVILSDMEFDTRNTFIPNTSHLLQAGKQARSSGTPDIYDGFLIAIRQATPVRTTNLDSLEAADSQKDIVTVDGLPAYESVMIHEENGSKGKYVSYHIYHKPSGKIYEINAQYNANKEEYDDLLQQILSTFTIIPDLDKN